MGRRAQVDKGVLGDMLYSLYFKSAIAPTMVPGTPFLFWCPSLQVLFCRTYVLDVP